MLQLVVLISMCLPLMRATPSPVDPNEACEAYVNRSVCMSGNEQRPSWCRDRNPYLLPRVITNDYSEEKQAMVNMKCEGGDCAMVNELIPLTVDGQRRFLTNVNLADEDTNAVILLEDNFQETNHNLVWNGVKFSQPGISLTSGFGVEAYINTNKAFVATGVVLDKPRVHASYFRKSETLTSEFHMFIDTHSDFIAQSARDDNAKWIHHQGIDIWASLSRHVLFDTYRLVFWPYPGNSTLRSQLGKGAHAWEIDLEEVSRTWGGANCGNPQKSPLQNLLDFKALLTGQCKSTCSVACDRSLGPFVSERKCAKYYFDALRAGDKQDEALKDTFINTVKDCRLVSPPPSMAGSDLKFGHNLKVSFATHAYGCTVTPCQQSLQKRLFGPTGVAQCSVERTLVVLTTPTDVSVLLYTPPKDGGAAPTTATTATTTMAASSQCPPPCYMVVTDEIHRDPSAKTTHISLSGHTTQIGLNDIKQSSLLPAIKVINVNITNANLITSQRMGVINTRTTDIAQQAWLLLTLQSQSYGQGWLEVVSLPEAGLMSTTKAPWAGSDDNEWDKMWKPFGNGAVTPAGVPVAYTGCSPGKFWDGAGCQDRPIQEVWTERDDLLQISEEWVEAPKQLTDMLDQVGCDKCPNMDPACIINVLANENAKVPSARQLQQLDKVKNLFNMESEMHVVKVSTLASEQVLVFYLFEAGSLGPCTTVAKASHLAVVSAVATNDLALMVQHVNTLTFMGSPLRMAISSNGYYITATMTRKKTEIDAMIRATELCEKLAANPGDPALLPYQDTCNQEGMMKPRKPTIGDFAQIATMCIAGSWCPDFENPDIDTLGAGFYSDYGFDRSACTPGHFCPEPGILTDCPIGFMCPTHGQTFPIPCSPDPLAASNCFGNKLMAPKVCPNGTLCTKPYLPPLPAPPGMVQTTDSNGKRIVEDCVLKDFCSLGRAISEGDQLLCPEGMFCNHTSVPEPANCSIPDVKCIQEKCPGRTAGCPDKCRGMASCPAGSVSDQMCPAGHFCPDPRSPGIPCTQGRYCPLGSYLADLCLKGYYCPSPDKKIKCPKGSYCPTGSSAPIQCSFLDWCPKGSAKKQAFLWSLIILFLCIILSYVGCVYARRYRDKRRKERQQYYQTVGHQRLGVLTTNRSSSIQTERATPSSLNTPLVQSEDSSDIELRASIDVSTQESASTHLAMVGSDMFAERKFRINFEFKNLGLKLKNGAAVLDGVSGSVRSGRVTAVMGPSGAGKSTFVTTLAGKAYYGETQGEILINGKRDSLVNYKSVVGFVPQEDIMMRDMTVKENIWFAAQLRLSNSWTKERKKAYRDSTIHILGLWDIRHSIIGDETTRGISGGQRKRVNIGIEMVADPVVLFLDEPTSGLDSTSSMEVCAALRKIADFGLTVITVIHQPRYEIFCSFHDVLLLGKGGRTVYLGPSEKALDYFSSIGFECPQRVNPPDFFMDVIAGTVPDDCVGFHPDQLFGQWENYVSARGSEELKEAPVAEEAVDDDGEANAQTKRVEIGFLELCWRFIKRSLRQQTRHALDLFLDNGLVVLAATSLSIIHAASPWMTIPQELPPQCFVSNALTSCGVYASGGQEVIFAVENQIALRGQMVVMAVGLTAVASAVKTFGRTRVVYWREAAALPQPKHTIAYFIGKDIAMLPQIIIGPIFFAVLFTAITGGRGSLIGLYMVLHGVTFASYAVGYLASFLVEPAVAMLLSIVIIFSLSMFDGGAPTIPQLHESLPPLNWGIENISFLTAALKAFYLNEAIEWVDTTTTADIDLAKYSKDRLGYDMDGYAGALTTLLAWGVGIRILGVVVLHFMDRNKKL